MKKLYGEFNREDWLKAIDLRQSDIPESFIIHGEWEYGENINIWKEIFQNKVISPKWNTIIGEYKNEKIGFSNVFWAPVAGLIVHQFSIMGTKKFIQTGYMGGLSNSIKYGDIFIVTEAKMLDGVSQWYWPERSTIKADEELVNKAINYCEKKKYSYVTGKIISTSAMLVETNDLVRGWAEDGYLGVDGETAATFAIAKKFDKKSISLLNISDHLIEGDTLYNYTKEREIIEEETDQRIRELALFIGTGDFS